MDFNVLAIALGPQCGDNQCYILLSIVIIHASIVLNGVFSGRFSVAVVHCYTLTRCGTSKAGESYSGHFSSRKPSKVSFLLKKARQKVG